MFPYPNLPLCSTPLLHPSKSHTQDCQATVERDSKEKFQEHRLERGGLGSACQANSPSVEPALLPLYFLTSWILSCSERAPGSHSKLSRKASPSASAWQEQLLPAQYRATQLQQTGAICQLCAGSGESKHPGPVDTNILPLSRREGIEAWVRAEGTPPPPPAHAGW